MKKRTLKNFKLSKKTISNFQHALGGKTPSEEKTPIEKKTDIIDCHTQQDESWCWE